jgi:hypothetical protein
MVWKVCVERLVFNDEGIDALRQQGRGLIFTNGQEKNLLLSGKLIKLYPK